MVMHARKVARLDDGYVDVMITLNIGLLFT